MKIHMLLLTIIAASTIIPGIAYTDSNVVSDVQEACAAEIETYCSNVTLGEGRLLACFMPMKTASPTIANTRCTAQHKSSKRTLTH